MTLISKLALSCLGALLAGMLIWRGESEGLRSRGSEELTGRGAGGPRVELLEDETWTRKRRQAERVMRSALRIARKYEAKGSEQKALEAKDQRLHLELVVAARDRADKLREEDTKEAKVAAVREKLDRELQASEDVLAMHQHRLEELMAQRRQSEEDATNEAKEISDLRNQNTKMENAVERLQKKVDDMKKGLKQEEADAKKSYASETLEKMLNMYLHKEGKEAGRGKQARGKAEEATKRAAEKESKAEDLQKELDKKKQERKHTKDADKKVDLNDQISALESQIKVLEQEVTYERKRANVMKRTANLQEKMADTDRYHASTYRSKLKNWQHHMDDLSKQIVLAPEQIKAAQASLDMAKHSEDKVKEKLRVKTEKRQKDWQDARKDQVLTQVQAKEIHKMEGLVRTQEKAVGTAEGAEASEAKVVASDSQRVEHLVQQSRNLRQAAVSRSKVAATWDSAATSELKEAQAYGKVVEKLTGAHKWDQVASKSRREASQMRHGLQLMDVKSAIRRFDRDPTPGNRVELERLERLLEDRLGKADDAQENAAGIQELNAIEDVLDHLDRAEEEESSRGRYYRNYRN